MNDGWIYFTLDTTPSILFPLCRAEFYFKIKRANKACTGRFAALLRSANHYMFMSHLIKDAPDLGESSASDSESKPRNDDKEV